MTDELAAAADTVWAELTSIHEIDRPVGLRWLSGLSMNGATPADVLLSLVEAGFDLEVSERREIPAEVREAAAARSGRPVRVGRIQRGIESAPYPGALPPATPEAIAAMAAEVPDIDPQSQTSALWWIGALAHDADAMRQLAVSPNLFIRRSVARAAHLPEDVAALLGRDEDRVVRLFLAESCDDAPAETLLEVASWWPGSLSFPGRPRNHPNFPREGLLRFATDPNPRLRLLALDDPAATAAVAEELAHDTDKTVRMAATEDRRLAPDSLRRLAFDSAEGVRWRAWMNPSLPAETLVKLLLDVRSAEFAAHNPAIPHDAMRHMVVLGRRHTAG